MTDHIIARAIHGCETDADPFDSLTAEEQEYWLIRGRAVEDALERAAGTTCEDEGCPHFGNPHSHPSEEDIDHLQGRNPPAEETNTYNGEPEDDGDETLYASPPRNWVTGEIDTTGWAYQLGDRVTKRSGSSWTGPVVGFYQTELTPRGYCVKSENERGNVQIYPEAALVRPPAASAEDDGDVTLYASPPSITDGWHDEYGRECG